MTTKSCRNNRLRQPDTVPCLPDTKHDSSPTTQQLLLDANEGSLHLSHLVWQRTRTVRGLGSSPTKNHNDDHEEDDNNTNSTTLIDFDMSWSDPAIRWAQNKHDGISPAAPPPRMPSSHSRHRPSSRSPNNKSSSAVPVPRVITPSRLSCSRYLSSSSPCLPTWPTSSQAVVEDDSLKDDHSRVDCAAAAPLRNVLVPPIIVGPSLLTAHYSSESAPSIPLRVATSHSTTTKGSSAASASTCSASSSKGSTAAALFPAHYASQSAPSMPRRVPTSHGSVVERKKTLPSSAPSPCHDSFNLAPSIPIRVPTSHSKMSSRQDSVAKKPSSSSSSKPPRATTTRVLSPISKKALPIIKPAAAVRASNNNMHSLASYLVQPCGGAGAGGSMDDASSHCPSFFDDHLDHSGSSRCMDSSSARGMDSSLLDGSANSGASFATSSSGSRRLRQ